MTLEQYRAYFPTSPTVTVAIPSYNEAEHIEQVIKGFLATNYPCLVEVLVADGGSTDRTQDIVKDLSLLDSRVKLLINPKKIQSGGLNLMILEAKGDVFLRADAHCEYAPDYIEKCIEGLLESKALNVGGSQRYVAANYFQAGIALASRSFLNGGAKYRDPNYNGYADTVYLGCFLTKALVDIAFANPQKEAFDTTQVTNQDAELNLKLIEIDTQSIYVSSKIKVWYFPRKNWLDLCKQFFKYGRGRYLTSTKHNRKSPIRSKLPFIFLLSLVLLLAVDIIGLHGKLHTIAITSFLLIIPVIEALRMTFKFSKNFDSDFWRGTPEEIPSTLVRFYFCFIALVTMPISYALGFAYQIGRRKIFRIEGW